MIDVTIHIEADRLAAAIEILAASILGTPASKAEGTQFQLQPVRGHEAADPAPVRGLLAQQAAMAEPVQETVAPAPAATVSLEMVRAVLAAKGRAGKKDEITALLKEFGGTVLTAIDPAKFGELRTAAERL
jgi:hypothetical protein